MTFFLLGLSFHPAKTLLAFQWGFFIGILKRMMNPLVLPFPPSGNTYYRSVRIGQACRVLLSKKGREYKNQVCEHVANYICNEKEMMFPFNGRLSVHVWLHPPNRRKFDIDNRIKPLLDALQFASVYHDDEAVDHLVVRRDEITKGGQAIVQIFELQKEEQT